MTERRSFTADELARELDLNVPTDEQRRVIESPVAPALVVAGAGSGKTETMAFRALWLIANGHVRPAEILGLTFTRKAAGELSERMRERVGLLRSRGLIPEPLPDAAGADAVVDPAAELLDTPTVSTYNSFAGGIFRDHAALIGLDGDAVVLGEASAWLLARRLVLASRDLRLADTDKTVDTVTSAVVALAGAIGENVADPAAIVEMAGEFAALDELPHGDRFAREAPFASLASGVRSLPVLAELAGRFAEVKAERGYIEFSDQVASALAIVEAHDTVGVELRRRFGVVILDEYQDTSVVQTRLLARLFRGHPVMAVGDPNQAIYGWRGASAANLGQFGEWFDASSRFSLTTSWRNGRRVLDAANRVLEPLAGAGGVPVDVLRPRTDAGSEPVDVLYSETVPEEAAGVASWFRRRLADPANWTPPKEGAPEGSRATPPSAALILRSRSTLEHFTRAFTAAGVEYHVLGVGGLLAEPLIADLVAALAVVDDPTASSEAIRLLVGSRWRVGVADIGRLRELARWIERRDLSQRELDPEVRAALRASVATEDSASLVDALDFLATAKPGHGALAGFSEEGLRRLREAGTLFAALRSRTRLDLTDLVQVVIEALDLDIEAEANDARPGSARVFEAFFDALADFERLGDGATLTAFLGWLREAESRDRLAPRSDPPEPGRVQIITIHGSKGLEWDLVAVPRLVEGELPGAARSTGAWVSFGQLPFEFRGDSAALPVFAWRGAETRKELLSRFDAFKQEVRAQQLQEDRRLAYVAITRARRHLLLSGSFWSRQKAPRRPSTFLAELAEVGVVGALPEAPEAAENPLLDVVAEAPLWPRDPLGSRRGRVERAAAEVAAALDAEPPAEQPAEEPPGAGAPAMAPARLGAWEREVRLLLEERRRRLAGGDPVELPLRIPASRFKDYVSDPAGTTAQLRRPMPERPYRATRLGTLFHSWVEESVGMAGGADELDAAAFELDGADERETAADLAALGALQETFFRSPWAGRRPLEVEREIHLPFADRIVICKIDAVYDLGGGRVEVVDWKTGKAPRDADDLERKQLQLALYRLAYSRWAGLDPEAIDAVFYFVADDEIIRPERVDSEAQLLERWRAVFPA